MGMVSLQKEMETDLLKTHYQGYGLIVGGGVRLLGLCWRSRGDPLPVAMKAC